MSQVQIKAKERTHRSRRRKNPVRISFKDLGYVKKAIVEYNLPKDILHKWVDAELKDAEEAYHDVLRCVEEYKKRGERPPCSPNYLKEVLIPRLKKFKEYLSRKKFRSQKEVWEWLETEGYGWGVWPLAFLRAQTFDKVMFPVVSKLVGEEVMDYDEGSREFMTESDARLIHYYDKEGRVYSIWVQWEHEKDNPLKGKITFMWEPGYEG